jgi:L-iditol 2-dehydrogenase
MGTPNHTLPISEACHREINLITSWRYADAYQKAIEISREAASGSLVNGQRIPCIQNLITHRFIGLNSIPKAFGVAARTRDEGGKLVVKTVVNL